MHSVCAQMQKHNMDLTDFTMGTVGQCYVQSPQGLNH